MAKERKGLNIDVFSESSNPKRPFTFTGSGTFKEGDLAINRKGLLIKGESPKNALAAAAANNPQPNDTPPMTGPFSLDDFKTIKVLGQGAGGVVRKVQHLPTNAFLALKVLTLEISDTVRKQIITELKTLYANQSEYLVSFYDAFFTEGSIYIALEYMDGGSLEDLYKAASHGLDEKILANITIQVLRGLAYLQTPLHIVHRDIKPSNILLNTKGKVKIADFGVSSQRTHTLSQAVTWVGTVTYMSPERISGKSYSFNSDIWSLGLTILDGAMGKYPYSDLISDKGSGQPIPFFDLLNIVVTSPPPALPAGKFSADFYSFVEACLRKEPEHRPTANELLKHPFILKNTTDAADVARYVQYVKRNRDAK